MKKQLHRKYFIIAAIVIGLFLLILLNIKPLTAEGLFAFLPNRPVLAGFLLIFLFGVKSIVFIIPVVVLYLGAGMALPIGWAIAVAYFGLSLEMVLGYLIGKKLGKNKVTTLANKYPKAAKLLMYANRYDETICLLLRLLPGPPIEIVSMFLGAMGVPMGRYLLYSLLGITPTMLPWVFAGTSVLTPLSKGFLIPAAIGLCISLILFFLVKHIEKQREKPRNR